jgi:hypothetical protein
VFTLIQGVSLSSVDRLYHAGFMIEETVCFEAKNYKLKIMEKYKNLILIIFRTEYR